MTALAVQAAALACVLGGYTIASHPLPGAPLWTLPPLPDFEPVDYVSTLVGWSPVDEIGAAPAHNDAAILDGGGHLPMTTGEFAALLTADPADVDVLDAIEATLRTELDWVIASALLWLGADLETEHTLASLADYPGDTAFREQVLAHA